MRNFYTLVLALFVTGLGFGQTTIFSESGGGSEPTDWTFQNNVTSNDIDRGSYWLVDAGNPSDLITTATYDLSSYTDAEFTMNIRSFGGGTHHSALIEISYDGGTSFTQTETSNITTGSYTSIGAIVLNSISSQVVLRISNTGTSGRGIRMQNLELSASGVASSVNNPDAFSATESSPTQIDLTYEENANGDDVVIVFNTTGTFSAPTGAPPAAGMSFSGGTVLVQSTSGDATFNHTSLTEGTTYYYKAYSYDGTDYSSGLDANATIPFACPAITSIMIDSFTDLQAIISWTIGDAEVAWEIVVQTSTGEPTGSGTATTNNPHTELGLSENTTYEVWVRADCTGAGNGFSNWVGPVTFTTEITPPQGSLCDNPIDLGTLPFAALAETTIGFGDDYSGSPGASGCGSTSDYLNGDDIVYAYTSDEDGTINVDLTNITDTYTGVFIYNSCADIGTNCQAGDVNGSSTADLSIPLFSVTNGQTYYIVVSTWAAPQTTTYDLSITKGTSNLSDIIEASYDEPNDIDYTSYPSVTPLTDLNAIKIGEFTIRDEAGAPDSDGFGTTLTDISFTVAGFENIDALAIFEGPANQGEVTNVTATTTFNNINSGSGITAAFGSSTTFSVYATFKTIVTDNDQIQLTVTSATADSSGSTFAAVDAGGATNDLSETEDNRIVVTASKLVFSQQPPAQVAVDSAMPDVIVEARDTNENVDIDFVSNIDITSTGILSPTTITVAAAAGSATFSTITHTEPATDLELTATDGLLSITSTMFDVNDVVVFEKINSLAELTDGEYVIVEENDGFAMNNTHNGTYLARSSVSPSADEILDPSAAIVWSIETNGSGRTIYNEASDRFVSYTGGSNNVQVVTSVTSDNQRWTISFASGVFVFNNSQVTSRILKYNSSNPRFACYTGGQRDINLYKKVQTPTITTSSPAQVGATNLATGATNQILSHFQGDISVTDATLNSLSFTTTGTYQTADVTGNFQLWYGNTNVFGNATSIGNVTADAPGTFNITGLTQIINNGNTGYFWITADIDVSGTNGRTLQVSADPSLTFALGTPIGTIDAGGEKTISTAVIAPTVITSALSNKTHNSISSGGEVTADGNASVTVRGVVYNTSTNPTTADNATTDGTGLGIYTSNITSLTPETQYFLRAYATNAGLETGYGTSEFNFRTLSAPATVQASALSATDVQETSIELDFTGATFPGSGASEAGYIVLFNAGSAPVFSANNGEAPAVSTGSIFSTNATILPVTPATTVQVTSLVAATEYQFLVIPYTWDGTNVETYNYLTTLAPVLTESTATPPAPAAGWQISSENTAFVIDFETTVADVNLGVFDGTGFTSSPASGQLDSDAWEVTGLSDGTLTYGGSRTSGDYTGSNSGGSAAGGINAFDTGGSNSSLGVQPTGGDFTPGTITVRAQNQTGNTVTTADLAYIVYVYNDQGRASTFNLSYSTDDSSYTDVTALDLTSTESADGSPVWVSNSKSTSITGLSIANGDYLYLRWSSADVSGSGSRDEFTLDDISLNFNPVPIITYTYNGTWSPGDPNGASTSLEEIVVESSNAVISTNTSINTVTVNPGASLTINTGITLAASTVTLESVSNNYSSLMHNGTVVGTIKYERYVNSTTNGKDLIASPLSGETWANFLSSGTNAADLLDDGNTNPTTYAFGPFNKTTGAYLSYTDATSTTLTTGTGYRVATDIGTTLTFTGTVPTGNVAVNIDYSGTNYPDWNLIGNPYPSYIHIGDFLSQETAPGKDNIDIFYPNTGIYAYTGRNGLSEPNEGPVWDVITVANAGTRLMAPGQAFLVPADTDDSITIDLTFNEAMRRTGTGDDFIAGRDANALTFLDLGISTQAKWFNTEFYFNENASLGTDHGYDATLLGNAAPSFALYSHFVQDNTGLPIALQALHPSDLTDVTIPLGVNANQGEQLTFSIRETSLPSTVNVYLEDNVANTSTLLNTGDYILTPANNLSGTGRFYLRITDSALSTIDNTLSNIGIFTNELDKTIVITGQLLEPTKANLYDLQGRMVNTTELDTSKRRQSIDTSHLRSGVYIVQLSNATQSISQKVIIR